MDTHDKHEELKVLEGEKLIENHEYDGIHELDNSPPPWLMGIWWLGVAFAVAWLLYFHVFNGPGQYERYDKTMAKAQEQLDAMKANQPAAEAVVADLAKGKQLFTTHCVVCHRDDLGGLVGPNLTDIYWIHGGSFDDIVKLINEGVPAKGMISWKTQLSNADIQQLTHYILSLAGSNPANPKAPEGQPYQPQQ